MKATPRPYVMKARADAAAATRDAILDATRAMLLTHSFDDITLDAVAERAETTGRTVLRLFAGKEGLLEEALRTLGAVGRKPAAPGDVAAFLASMFDLYERIGDTVIRWLADEVRLPAMRERLAFGRAALRADVAAAFAPHLGRRPVDERGRLHDALIVACDVYTWKLLRRDFGLDTTAALAVVRTLVDALVREDENG